MFLALLCARSLHAASGDLDPTFGTGGIVITPIGSGDEIQSSMAVQCDGKIVVAGYSGTYPDFAFAVARYTPSGTLDSSFGIGGKVTTDVGSGGDYGQAVVLRSDGTIVLAGFSVNSSSGYDFAVVRYMASGGLDPSFGAGGKVLTDFSLNDDRSHSLAVQSDGKIIVAGSTSYPYSYGYQEIALARYNADGSLDTKFGSGGKVTSGIGHSAGAEAVVVQSDGKIVAAGCSDNAQNNLDFAVLRFMTNGMLDPSFGTGGEVITSFATGSSEGISSIAVQSDGKIIAAGYSYFPGYSQFALTRYTPNGALDTNFGMGGKVTTPIGTYHAYGKTVAVQTDGKIVVAGYGTVGGYDDFVVVRYTTNGALDTSFGMGGKVATRIGTNNAYAKTVALQSDGKIVVAGYSINPSDRHFYFTLARYLGDGPPSLNIRSPGTGRVTISWIASTSGFLLQETLSLSAPAWTNAPTGATNPATLPAALPSKFYRLYHP